MKSTLENYVTAKVKSIVASIEGVTSTEEKKHDVQLTFLGNPFFDRDLDRHSLSFRTPSRWAISNTRPRATSPSSPARASPGPKM